MRICITPHSIKLLATYFKNAIPSVVSEDSTYEDILSALYKKALSDFSGEQITAQARESVLQHMTIVPQMLSEYDSTIGSKLNADVVKEVKEAKDRIYKATQVKDSEALPNEILKMAEVLGVVPIEIVRLNEVDRYDAVSWHFPRTISQEDVYSTETGYKENQNDPEKAFETGVESLILGSRNIKGYKFKLVPYSSVKNDASSVDTTGYRTDEQFVLVVTDKDGNIVKFDNDLKEDSKGRYPLFQLKSKHIEFEYQARSLALALAEKNDIPLYEAKKAINDRLDAHIININKAIAKVKDNKEVFFEMDLAISGYGFIELNEAYHTPLTKVTNLNDIHFFIELQGTNQKLAKMNIPHSNMPLEVKAMPLQSIDQATKDTIIDLLTNNKLTHNGKVLSKALREKLIMNYLNLSEGSKHRPDIILKFGWKKEPKIVNGRPVYQNNDTLVSVTLGENTIKLKDPDAKKILSFVFDKFISTYRGYETSANSEGRLIADSLDDVTIQNQFYKDENGVVKIASKPEVSLGLRAKVTDINSTRTTVDSIVDDVVVTSGEQTVKEHVISHGYVYAMPTKTGNGLILRGHGSYIGFNPIESNPDIEISEEKRKWRSISDNNLELAPTAQEEVDADNWFKNHEFAKVLKVAISDEVSEMGPSFVANFFKDSINLFQGYSNTDLYHETFHAYFDGLLTQEQRDEIYKEVKATKGTFTTTVNGVSSTLKFKDATNLEVEEYLAEEFREYARERSKYNKNSKSKVAQFFEKLLAGLKSLFSNRTVNEVVVLNKMSPIVQEAFKDLYEGNIDISKFVAPMAQKEEKWHSLEADKKLKLSYQDVSIVMGSVQALISEYINTALNSVSTPEANGLIMEKMAELSTLDVNNPAYLEISDSITKEIHSVIESKKYGTPNGYGVFRLNETPIALEYALTFVKESLRQRLEVYKGDPKSVIARKNVKLLEKVIENFGDVKAGKDSFKNDNTTILGLFFNNYNIISTDKVTTELDVDDSDSLEEGLRAIYGMTGAEFSPHQTADAYTEQLLSSILKYYGQGEGKIQSNRIGVARILPFRTAIGKVIGITKGLLYPGEMYDAMVVKGETDKEMSQIALKLGDPRGKLSRSEQRQWTAFWHSIARSSQEVRVFSMEKVDVEEGVESHYIAKSGKFKEGSSIIGREWKGNFADNLEKDSVFNEGGLFNPEQIITIYGEMFRKELETEDTSSLREYARLREIPKYESLTREDLITKLAGKKFIPIEGSNDLYHDRKLVVTEQEGIRYRSRAVQPYVANPFPMLRALGIVLPETREVRDAIVYGSSERGIEAGIVGIIFKSLRNREDAVVPEDMLIETFEELFQAFEYQVTDFNTDIQPDISGYLTMLKDIGEEMSDDFVNNMGRNADGEMVSERPYHSALTIQATTLNSAMHYDDVLNTPGMENFDYNYNPQVAATTWLVQMFRLDNPSPSIRGTRDTDIRITIDTLGGSKVKHGDLEKGISSLASDRKTKYISDFHHTLLGRQELFRMEAKNTSLTMFVPQYVRGTEGLRKGLVFNANEIESIFSENYLETKGSFGLLLFDQFAGHLEAELVRIHRLTQLEADIKAGKQIEFDQAYLDRGKKYYMFDNIFRGKHAGLKAAMLKKGITDSFTLKDILTKEEKKNVEAALRDYFILRANQEMDNYSQDLIIAENLIEEFAIAEEERDATVKRMTQSFIVNNFLENANFASAFLGDVALYNVAGEDFHKRIAGLISAGTLFRFDNDWYNYVNTPEYNLKGLANKHSLEKALPLVREDYKGYLNTGVIKEAVFKSLYLEHYESFFREELAEKSVKGLKAIAEVMKVKGYKKMNKAQLVKSLSVPEIEAYRKMEEADGQAWITLDAYRLLADSNNDWSNEQEETYMKILNGEEVDQMKIRNTFPVKKYQYYGTVANANALENVQLQMTAFHKYSLMPLIPGVIEGTPLEDLNNRMMESNIDYVTMESGSKLSTIKKLNADPSLTEADDIYNENREITQNSFTVNKIHVRHLKNQVSVSSEYKGKITLWTQMRSMISLGLSKDGIPMDYKGDKAWDTLTSTQKLNESDNWKLIQKTREVLDLMESELKSELIEDLGLKPTVRTTGTGKSKKTTVTYEGDTSRLVAYIQEQMRGEDMLPEEIAYIIDKDGQLIEDLSLSVNSEKIEKILTTMVDKKLRRLKVTGEGLTQVSGTMFEKKDSKPSVEDLEKYGTNGLATYFWENGTIRKMEVKIALQGDFKKLLRLQHPDKSPIAVYKKEGGLNFNESLARLNEAIKDEKWLEKYGDMITITGPRIPSQQENSLEAAVVAEFLPPIAGPIIILPSEVVAKAGSDFDHDKLFMMFMNIVSYGRGKNVKVQVQKFDRTLKATRKELGKDLEKVRDGIELLREKREKLITQRDSLRDEIKDVRDEIKNMQSAEDTARLKVLNKDWASSNGHLQGAIKGNYVYTNSSRSERDDAIAKYRDILSDIEAEEASIQNEYYARVEELVKNSKEIKPSTKANLTKNAKALTAIKESLERGYAAEETALRRLDSKSTKGLENELLQLFAERITMGNNMTALVQNNATDQVQPVSKELERLVKGSYDKYNRGKDVAGEYISGTTLYDYQFNLQKHQENSVAMDALGIAAVMSTFHAMFAQMGARLKGVTKDEQKKFDEALAVLNDENASDEGYSDAQNFIDKYSAYTLKFDHNFVENALGKQIALGFRNNAEGKTISSVIGQLINGYVDVAKDAWIFNVQGNKENTPVLLFMIMAGVPPKTAIYFSSSSLVREYTKIKQEADGVFSKLNTSYATSPIVDRSNILKEARAKMFAKYRDLITKNTLDIVSSDNINIVSNTFNGVYDNKTLKDAIEDRKTTWDDFVMFAHYLEIEDMSNDITRFTSNTKYSTQKISSISDAEGRRVRTGYALKSDNAVPNSWYDDMSEKTLNGIFNNDDFVVEIFSQYFKLRNHPMVVAASISIKPPVGVDKTVFQNDIKNDFIAFLAQNSLYGSDIYNGVKLIPSSNDNDPIDYNAEEGTYTYGEETLRDLREQVTEGLSNAGNSNMELLNKFPTDNHFIRYDIEHRKLILETENMTEKQIKNKYYYAFDSKAKIVSINAILVKLALYRSDNNIAMFDYRMGMSSILEQIKKKHPYLEEQFDLVYNLKRDYDKRLQKSNLFLNDISDPDVLRIYKENYAELSNSGKSEVKEFFDKFKIMALMQTGMNRRAKYDLMRVVDNDLFEVIINNGVNLDNVFKRLDEGLNQVQNGKKEPKTKYLDEFIAMFKEMAETSYRARNKGTNYITDDFEGKKAKKSTLIQKLEVSYNNAQMNGKVVKIAMGPQNRLDLLEGTKTTTIRSSSQVNVIGLAKGESAIMNLKGEKFVVTYRGMLSIEEAGGAKAMVKSEALPTKATEENQYELKIDGKKYYAKYRQTVDFLNNQAGLGIYDIRKAPNNSEAFEINQEDADNLENPCES